MRVFARPLFHTLQHAGFGNDRSWVCVCLVCPSVLQDVVEEEEIVSSTPLGPAATWTKEYLAKQAEDKRRALAAEVDEAKSRVVDVLSEMSALINPAERKERGLTHLPGQGPRGNKHFLSKHSEASSAASSPQGQAAGGSPSAGV